MIHRPLANVHPLPKPTTTHGHGVVYSSDDARRWTATFAANIVAFQATGDSPIPALQALATTLADWVACSRDGLGLQMRWTRRGAQLGLSLVVSVVGDSPAALEPLVLRNRRDLSDVLAAARSVRGELVEDVWQVEALREAEAYPDAVVAQPFGGGTLPLAAEALEPTALGRVVDLLLTGDTETTLVVSMRRAHDGVAITQLAGRISAALAETRGRAEGARFTSGSGTSIRRLPEDLVPLVGAVGLLEREAAWAARLRVAAVETLVAVVSAAPVGAPLLHAVGRALVPSQRMAWVEVGEIGAAAILADANTALDAIPTEPVASDTLGSTSPLPGIAARWLPVDVAACLLVLPTPGGDGIPGVPMDPLVVRPVPNAVRSPSGDASRLGDSPSRGTSVPVRMTVPDLQRHLYVCGKTGVGKSTLVKTLLVDLARKGHGVGVIDPHGDLADEVIEAIGRERKVVVFDPSREDCLGLNPLGHDGTDDGIEGAMEELTRTMFSLYPQDMMGPMFDRHSRALLLPLLCSNESLADVAKMATDELFRFRTLRALKATNPLHADIRRFWEEEFKRWSEHHKGEMITYTVSKYDALVKSSALRRVCDPTRPQLDVNAVLAEGGVLVARLPEATLGPVSAWFLGMMLLSRLREAAFARGSLHKRDRRPFVLALDEFQKFVGGGGFGYKDDTRTLGPMLDECRKFGVSLVLANQYIAQLDGATRNAIFGNVGSMVCFRAGASDAELLADELGHGASAAELRALPLYHGLARLLVNGQATPVFTVRTIGGDGR